MKKKVKFKTYSELLNDLNKRGLKVSGEKSLEILKSRGYYNLVNRYKDDLYQKNTHKFDTQTSIETLYHLHSMEDDLRNILFRFTLTFEQFLKESMSYIMADTWGVDPKNYLDPKKYPQRRGNKIPNILCEIDNVKKTLKNPTKYYKDNYEVIPPWILLNNVMFGQSKMLFKIFPNDLKRYVIHQMMPFDFYHYTLDKYSLNKINKKEKDNLINDKVKFDSFLSDSIPKRIELTNWLEDVDPYFYKAFSNSSCLNKTYKKIDDERIEMFSNIFDAIHKFRNTLAHGSRIVHFHFKNNLKLKLISKYTGANFDTKEFQKENLGNGVFGILLGLLVTLDKFDTALLISKLNDWQKDATRTYLDKKDYELFKKSCELPEDFISILSNIRKNLYSTKKTYDSSTKKID